MVWCRHVSINIYICVCAHECVFVVDGYGLLTHYHSFHMMTYEILYPFPYMHVIWRDTNEYHIDDNEVVRNKEEKETLIGMT